MRTRQELVNDLFWGIHAQGKAVSRKEICSILGYKSKSPSPHIIKIIESLVTENYLVKIPVELHNGLLQYKYYANQNEVEALESKSSLT